MIKLIQATYSVLFVMIIAAIPLAPAAYTMVMIT